MSMAMLMNINKEVYQANLRLLVKIIRQHQTLHHRMQICTLLIINVQFCALI